MLSRIISEELIQLNVQAKDWEDAIRKSAAPLLKKRKITQEYIDKIIEITQTTGPYIVITKHTALPHASSKFGAKEKAVGQCHLVKCHWDFQRHREINFNFTMPFFLSVKH